ncbi:MULTISPECIES: adenylyl-sulfate kinase [Rheinheimera]|uniref:Adenylyl-sulfate kinase n=1 Tax=Rheinheimera marina TaxID=1774958 RepID=A0ABV9JJ76_9GAMM
MSNVVWQNYQVSRTDREQQNGHQARVLWFTGLSGAGKSTIANALEQELVRRGIHSYLLDGDNVRHGLCADLGFSEADRTENLRRVGAVAGLMLDAGLVVLSAFISPYRAQRDKIRQSLPEGKFLEIYVATSLDVCEQRDVKGLYKKARQGEISHFTGISDPYEPPQQPDLVLDTAALSIEQSVAALITLLQQQGVIR